VSATRWCRRPDVLTRRSLDALLLLPVEGDDLVTLARTGPEVWGLLAEPRTLDELAAILADRYGAPQAVVAADVQPILDALVEGGLVEVLDDPPQGP
jgi:hypothetical protein